MRYSDFFKAARWAYVEVANVIVLNQAPWSRRHAVRLYQHLRDQQRPRQSSGTLARHLAEASYWILRRAETYRDPALDPKGKGTTNPA